MTKWGKESQNSGACLACFLVFLVIFLRGQDWTDETIIVVNDSGSSTNSQQWWGEGQKKNCACQKEVSKWESCTFPS